MVNPIAEKHDTFFIQTCLEEVDVEEQETEEKPLFSMRSEDAKRATTPGGKKRDAKLNYARQSRRSWPPKRGQQRDKAKLREEREEKITTW